MKRSKGIHVFKKPSFSKKKEKDFKIKEKPKEEKHKEEKHKEEKHKEKKSKDLTAADVVKQWKEKKKKKKPIQEPEVAPVDVPSLKPIFGIPLAEAAERTMMYDGVRLPAVFRECVDYVEKHGMRCEGIYRVSGTCRVWPLPVGPGARMTCATASVVAASFHLDGPCRMCVRVFHCSPHQEDLHWGQFAAAREWK